MKKKMWDKLTERRGLTREKDWLKVGEKEEDYEEVEEREKKHPKKNVNTNTYEKQGFKQEKKVKVKKWKREKEMKVC